MRTRKAVGEENDYYKIMADLFVDRAVAEPPDRTVHVSMIPVNSTDRLDLVRYHRAGKWWLEGTKDGRQFRQQISTKQATDVALSSVGCPWIVHYPGKPGGKDLDGKVRRYAAAYAEKSSDS